MKSFRYSRTTLSGLLVGSALCFAFSLPAAAQVQTQSTEASGAPTREVTIERGEIVYVNGRNVIIKMEDGTLRHFENVPDSVHFIVDGKQVNIHDAKVGMVLQKETVRTTTPKIVTTVQTVTGKVWHVSPPNSVVLTLENGENQRFNIPKGQKFIVDGQETDAFGLRKGMMVTAQKVVEEPMTVVEDEYRRTGKMPPPVPAPQADVPILVATAPPAPAPVETAKTEDKPVTLPKTASDLPLMGLLGALFCALALTATAIRKFAN
jgi:hypothetical protein